MIREPVVAGTFYPDDRNVLYGKVYGFMRDAACDSLSGLIGLVSPHAGYIYSGAVAGTAYASAPETVDTVVIVAPSHRYPLRGYSVFDGAGFRTPLGIVSIDRELTSALLEAGCMFQPAAHMSEHSAEVQVPFIQVRWPDADIAVILQGDSSEAASKRLAELLSSALSARDRTLVVASSDLSHYHPLRLASAMDERLISAFCSGDPEKIEALIEDGEAEACGSGPMMTMMHYCLLGGCTDFGRISYDTSATASGDRSAVVGYFSGYAARKGDPL